MNESWEQDEFKALNEFCSNNHFSYEVIAISFFSKATKKFANFVTIQHI